MKRLAVFLTLAVVFCLSLTSCSVFIAMLDSMLEHEHSYTYTLIEGESEGTFDLRGVCAYEYCENPTFTKKNVQVYISSEEAGSCTEEGKIVYSHNIGGGTVSITVSSGKADHTIGGVPVGELTLEDGTLDSGISGVSIPDGSECESIVGGSYVCDGCGIEQSVSVYVSHKGNFSTVTKPTCTEEGREKLDCLRCGKNVERSVDSLGHNYEVEMIPKADGLFDLLLICGEAGCASHNMTFEDVKNITLSSEKTPTCLNKGEKTYTYEKNGTTSSVTYTERKLPHRLNGADINSLLNSDGTLDFGAEGIFADESALTCGKNADGHYRCDLCTKNIPITVYVRAHHIEESGFSVIAPTCQADGQIIKECKYCSYKKTEIITRESPELYHNITASVVLPSSDTIAGALTTLMCTVDGCDVRFENAEMDNGSYSFVTENADCKTVGKIIHRWTVSGIPVEYVSENMTTDHILVDSSGKRICAFTIKDSDGNYDYNSGAVSLFAGGSISCGGTSMAFIDCVECGGVVMVTAIKHHNMQTQSRTEPTCKTNGKLTEKCSECGKTQVSDIPAAHTIENIHDYESGTLVTKCTRGASDCDYQQKTLDLSDGTLTVLRVISPSSCQHQGVAQYSFTYTDGGAEKTITFIGKLAVSDHFIKDNHGNVVCVDTLYDENGYLDSSLDSIEYFANSGNLAVGQTGNGYYICEECESLCRVTVINTGK